LHLSGTPFKAVASGKFSDEQIFNWTYTDEQEAKALWFDVEHNNPYEKLPQLNLFSYQMSQMITDEVNKGAEIDGKDIDFAFDLNEFFETNESGKFVHESEVNKWLDTLSKNHKYPFSTKELRAELKHTFWLLNRIASAKALVKLLKEHPVFENYEIILAAGDGTDCPKIRNKQQKKLLLSTVFLGFVKIEKKAHKKPLSVSSFSLSTPVSPPYLSLSLCCTVKITKPYLRQLFSCRLAMYTIHHMLTLRSIQSK
jgi:hypothetical protein